MRRGKFDSLVSVTRLKLIRVLMGAILLYMLLMSLEIPLVFRTGSGSVPGDGFNGFINDALVKPLGIQIEEEFRAQKESKKGPTKIPSRVSKSLSQFQTQKRRIGESKMVSGLAFSRDSALDGKNGVPELQKSAKRAWVVGNKLWEELNSGKIDLELVNKTENWPGTCPDSILLSGSEFGKQGKVMAIPCGLTLGSNIALVGKPQLAHAEYDPKISEWRNGNEPVMVTQFMMELQGLDTVDGEEPPRILHFNPRLKGDWSRKPVIELNTRYRMQWGLAFRCEGWKSKADEETVDGQVKCEKWIRDDDGHSKESKTVWWLSKLVGRTKKVTVDWPYPFVEEKLFILTLSAGLEGYHINVDGRHVTSFPYRTGFTLEDATGLSLSGDIDVYSIVSASLPTSHPSSASEKLLEMLSQFQAPPLPSGPVDIFIGVLSAGNHFAERMAIRKTWMRHESIRASNVVARFFVALHGRKEVNLELKKEAEYFGDVVIVPYMDHYDLVVLKTVAICEYGVRTVAAKYIMKCDDDTFVRVEAVIEMVMKLPGDGRSLYVGNINYYHRPLRYGKWEVTYEEWPEENYPPYANGPGYIVSSDIAHFIVSEFEKHKLRLFKMEDVSMGMWVQKFNASLPVEYVHSDKFCQFGCIENYYTAHYQSPRQMMCLWDKLKNQGIPRCCDTR